MAAPAPAASHPGTVKVDEWVKTQARRLEAYLKRLPLLTRVVILAIAIVHFLISMGVPLNSMFSLDPAAMGLDQMHRLNTYPLVHVGWLHAVMNLVALTPLLERFEREIGTLKTTLLIAGPIVTFPAGLYLLIEMGIFRGMTAVVGASALVFTFLANEAVKTHAFRPSYTIANVELPSYLSPMLWMLLASFLMPGSSFLGHLCGLIIGYAFGLRYLRLLEPSEWILNKVESILGFVLLRLPWYVSLEKRTEGEWLDMLPTTAPRPPHSPVPGSFEPAERTLGATPRGPAPSGLAV